MGLAERVADMMASGGRHWVGSDVAVEAHRLLSLEAPLADPSRVDDIVANVVGMGPIDPLLQDESVTDILVNGPTEIWVDRGVGLERTELVFEGEAHLMATIERTSAAVGVRVDRASPIADGRLPDGSRLHVSIPPAAADYPVLAIRRFSPAIATLDELAGQGSATADQVVLLRSAAESGESMIVSGGTGAGKTTLLNLLAGSIPPGVRVVTVEDAAELRFPGHVVRLEARPPNAEGMGEVTIRELLRAALRLRPDRIVLGEVRGPEALDLITALNTGHRGSMSTVHANSPEEAMWRLETLALLDGAASPEAVRRQLYAAVDLVVQVSRQRNKRSIAAIARVGSEGVEVLS